MVKIHAVLFSLAVYWVIFIIFKIPSGIGVALFIATAGVIFLVYICALIVREYKVLKDYPLGTSLIQYSFVSISSIYLGDSMGKSLRGNMDLDMPPLAAAIFVGVFCVASISELKIPAAQQDDIPEIGKKVSNLRSCEVVKGTLLTIIIPIFIGSFFGYFLNKPA